MVPRPTIMRSQAKGQRALMGHTSRCARLRRHARELLPGLCAWGAGSGPTRSRIRVLPLRPPRAPVELYADGRARAAAVHPEEGERLRVQAGRTNPTTTQRVNGPSRRRSRRGAYSPFDVRRWIVVQSAGGAGGHRRVRSKGAVLTRDGTGYLPGVLEMRVPRHPERLALGLSGRPPDYCPIGHLVGVQQVRHDSDFRELLRENVAYR